MTDVREAIDRGEAIMTAEGWEGRIVTDNVVAALSRAAADIGAVAKTDRNESQRFNFRGIDAVVNATHPAFRKHGIIVAPTVRSVERESYTTKNGTAMVNVHAIVAFRFYGPQGDWIDTVVAAEAADSGDKATPKVMSVALRIALLQVLLLPTDEADPDASSHERAAAGSPRSAVAAPVDDEQRTKAANAVKAHIFRLVNGDKDAAQALYEATADEAALAAASTSGELHAWVDRTNAAVDGEADPDGQETDA